VDFNVNARLQNGVLLQGGVSTGRASTNNCEVMAIVPEALGTAALQDCNVVEPFRTQVKAIAVYTVPKIQVQVAGTFQSIPGDLRSAVFTLSSSNFATSSTLGRASNNSGNQKQVNLLSAGTSLMNERLNQLDIRFGKIVKYGRTRTNLSVDLFNALNNDTITAVNTAYETLWRPNSILQGRFVKFSAQFDF
jgi:hypothetical protein